jgi:predicted RNase H-like nuclease (RuvC/YqgF family)
VKNEMSKLTEKVFILEARIADLSLQVESKDDIISTLQEKFEIDEDEMENILSIEYTSVIY